MKATAWGALLAIFFAISMGTAAIAGEEDTRTMDVLLANPIPRHRVVLESFAAMALLTALLAALCVCNSVVCRGRFEMSGEYDNSDVTTKLAQGETCDQ